MVWPFSSQSGPAKADDGGTLPPSRSSRQQCWIARDKFFTCLDENNIVNAIAEDDKARKVCGQEIKEFETACSKTWAKYFKEKRVMEINRDRMIEKIKAEEDAINSTGKR